MLLLSIDYGEILIPAIIGLVIWFFLLRAAVRADSVIKNQQAIIWFLILQCKKQGATDEEIKNIKDHFGIQ